MKIVILILLIISNLTIFAQNSELMQFDTLTVNKYGLTFKNGVILDLSYQFIYPINNTLEINTIKGLMMQDFFSVDSTMLLNEAASKYEESIISDYANQNPNKTHQYNSQYSSVRVINDRVIVLMMQGYYYMGGIHGLEPVSFSCYDLKKGERITLNCLFDESNHYKLLELIKAEMPENSDKKRAFISDKFMLLPAGIQFFYNEYWITSYSEGAIRITIPYSRLKPLLRESACEYFE